MSEVKSLKGKRQPSSRRWMAALCALVLLVLGGCGLDEPAVGDLGYVTGFAGLVAADEPQAVLQAQDVLSAGGTAADAAVAMAFSLAVTYPSSAGLAGGGACLVHDVKTEKVEFLDFLPGIPEHALAQPGQGVPVAVPGFLRGIFALHARYGVMQWGSLLVGAERMARFGNQTSRALAQDLEAAGGRFKGDIAAEKVFFGLNARLPEVGDRLPQLDLASAIGRIRGRGVGDFYTGALGREFSEAAARTGARIDLEDLRAYIPRWKEAASTRLGWETLHVPPAPYLGNKVLGIWQSLVEAGFNTQGPEAAEKATMQAAEALKLPRGGAVPGSTGFVVVDYQGSSVVCGLTMNGPFGTGRMVTGFGTFTVPTVKSGSPEVLPLGLLLVMNENTHEFHFGAASAHGQDPLAGVAALAARAELADENVFQGSKTIGWSSRPGTALVNAGWCRDGVPSNPQTCRAGSDLNGASLGRLLSQDD